MWLTYKVLYIILFPYIKMREYLFGDIILIYQMGKVGSDSIYSALRKAGKKNVFHVHYIYPKSIDRLVNFKHKKIKISLFPILGYYSYNQLIKKNKKTTIISLIREPMERNVSAYFQNIDRIEGRNFQNTTVKELVKSFIQKYKHDIPLKWFDTEFKVSTGIDIYEYPFNKAKGFQVIESRNFRILILKSEINDASKGEIIEEFLNIDKGSITIKRSNTGANKSYSGLYSEFKENLKLSDEYIKKMKTSKFYKHFY